MATEQSYVFVSYSSEDEPDVAALVRVLENRGISFRFDRDLATGDAWKEKLRQWLDDAGAVLVVWSPHSASSAEVFNEATRARDRLVPIGLTGPADVPGPFEDLQILDLSAWAGDPNDPVLDELGRVLQARLASSASRRAAAPGGSTAEERRPGPGDGTAGQPGAAGKTELWYRRTPAWVGPAVLGPLIVGVILAFVSGFAARITGGSAPAASQQPIPSQSASPHASDLSTPRSVIPTMSHSASATLASPPLSQPPSASTAGTFTYPVGNAQGLPGPETITARGTVRDLEPGHHLLVFLQAGTKQTYWAGDPDVAVNAADGQWSGTVCIGFQGDFTLYLVDIGPAGLARLKSNQGALWGSPGMPFPPSRLAADVSVLSSVSADANGRRSQCTAGEPELY